jgi:26S proteasome regulatory subunit T2
MLITRSAAQLTQTACHTVAAGIHTSRMTLADDVDLEEFVMAKDDLSGADIKAICTEAGLMALRERRMKVTAEDFKKSKENVLYRKKEGTPEGLYL